LPGDLCPKVKQERTIAKERHSSDETAVSRANANGLYMAHTVNLCRFSLTELLSSDAKSFRDHSEPKKRTKIAHFWATSI
jgi:hypothetical protein